MNELNQRLRQHLNFEESDIEANRRGHMSPRQIEATRQLMKFAKPLVYLAAGVIWLMIAAFGAIFFALSPSILTVLVFILMLGMVTVGIAAIVVLFLNPRLKSWEENFQTGGIISMTGIVTVERRRERDGTGWDYMLHLNDYHFRVTQAHFAAFESGAEYTVYFSEKTRYILTAESQN